jgi:hypothetical protein
MTTGEDREVMRENIARTLAACVSRHGTLREGEEPEDSWEEWETEADAVLALIGPVMEENERLLKRISELEGSGAN